MASFLDTLARAVQDALEGFQRYQFQIRPALEERSAAAEALRRQLAGADLAIARQIYGTDEAIAEALGEEAYTNLVKAATGGRVVPAFRDVPITETVRGQRQIGTQVVRRPGPFADVEPAQPSRITVVEPPVPITGTGPGLARAGLPQRRVLDVPAPVAEPQDVEEPVFEEYEEERPTGKTRRELVLPGRVAEPTINVPKLGLRLTLSQAIKAFGQKGMRDFAGIVGPVEATQLLLDIEKAKFEQAHKNAQLQWEQFKHLSPSAYEQARLQLDAMKAASESAHREAQISLQRGQLHELKRWHDIQAQLQKEANNIRRRAPQIAAASKGGELRFGDLRAYHASLLRAIVELRQQKFLAVGNKALTEQIEQSIADLEDEEYRIRQILKERSGGAPATVAGQGKHRGQRVVYKTRNSGVLNAMQIEAAIANMQRRGLSPRQIAQELRNDDIPPEDFGF